MVRGVWCSKVWEGRIARSRRRGGLSPKSEYRGAWARSQLGAGYREGGMEGGVQGECKEMISMVIEVEACSVQK